MTVESNDKDSIATLVSQGPKVILSVGGWNFPSAYFSKMVASSESRQKFIASAKSFISENGLAGIDLDWEFPCSPKREDPVKISCDKFRQTEDAGGNCPADTTNLVQFLKELRSALGQDTYISVASQAAEKHWVQMGIKEGSQYVDHWHVMSYDYAVPDIADGATMSPNAPLYTPSAAGTVPMSINYTIQGYIAAGVPRSKIMIGLPFYGHTWYQSGMSNWNEFGGEGSVQGKCCGPFKSTYGAKPGQACSQCGVMMYSEILAAGCPTKYDDETKSDIMYCSSAGSDSYTEAGTWISYNDKKSIHEITEYTMNEKLAGIFVFDTSMDTVANGEFTFELMNQMADDLDAGAGPTPTPTPTPTPPTPSPSPSPGSMFRCVSGQCVASSGGVDEQTCESICTPSTYKCKDNQCVPEAGGASKETCEALCGSTVI